MYSFYSLIWFLQGARKPSPEEQKAVGEQVTFIYKSFERQRMARRLYRNIRSYYPDARIVIADDSRQPLNLEGNRLTVVQLPFNSGLSYGLKRALERVETPYVFRMDDDERLTLLTRVDRMVNFLERHPEVDLISALPRSVSSRFRQMEIAGYYFRNSMHYAMKELIIPHGTEIEKDCFVVGKAPNIYLVRTEKLREVGYDENIRMLDHNDFFYRAAGNIVSVLDINSSVFHSHDPFMREYAKYRGDLEGDRAYIKERRRIDMIMKQQSMPGSMTLKPADPALQLKEEDDPWTDSLKI